MTACRRSWLPSCAIVAFVLAGSAAGGPLAPPPGPVQSTDRERIIPQAIVALPYTILQPGSYVLTGNLVATPGQRGIVIDAENVTLDLGGFELNGGSVGTDAIYVNPPAFGERQNLSVFNGVIRGWSGAAIDFNAASNSSIRALKVRECSSGIMANYATQVADCSVEYVFGTGIRVGNTCSISNCTTLFAFGAGIETGYNCTVRGCAVELSSGPGYRLGEGSALADCVSRGNNVGKGNAPGVQAATGCTITGCVSSNNIGDGYSLDARCTIANSAAINNVGAGISVFGSLTATGCTASGNSFAGFWFNGGTVTDCTAEGNGAWGFGTFFEPAKFVDCAAYFNSGQGILIDSPSVAQGCTASQNLGTGIEVTLDGAGTQVIECNASRNSTSGISAFASCAIQGCQAMLNQGDGIEVGSNAAGTQVVDCTAGRNEGDGIRVVAGGVIRGCHAALNQGDGIEVRERCQVRENTCADNGTSAGGGPAAGIRCTAAASRIDSNHLTGNDVGLDAGAPFRNVIIRNSASGNAASNYVINPVNDAGPIGTAAAAVSPWANIAF